MKVKARL
ncbi:hypothetical protein CP061683_1189A, partial [Chlamydia psittaci 06-1683]